MTSHSMPVSNSRRETDHALIESIYRIALEPQTYDSFMELWANHISESLQEQQDTNQEDVKESATGIERHFEIALQLLDQVNTDVKPDTASNQQPDSFNPQFLIDSSGHIVWYSVSARTAFDLTKSSTIETLSLEPLQSESLCKMAKSLTGQTALSEPPLLLKLQANGHERPIYMYARILPEQDKEDVILVAKITPDWPEEMENMLASGFGLSKSEIAICALIAEGQGAAQISETRQSAVATVRTQTKKILGKTSCTSQVELVRLLHSIMRIAEQTMTSHWQAGTTDPQSIYIPLGDHTMPVNVIGAPEGFPIVYFHGMLDGCKMTRAFTAMLEENNLRMIFPTRPHFGAADGGSRNITNAATEHAKAIMKMMQTLDIDTTVFLGHMAGAIYAYAAAASKGPDVKIKGIVNVAGAVPIQSVSQFSSMSNRQQLVAYTARYSPKILPFVLRAGISQLKSGGEKKFMRSLYVNSPNDTTQINEPEVFEIISSGFHCATHQGQKAFQIDSYHVVRDWSEFVDKSDIPMNIIHGVTDPVVSIESVKSFYRNRSNLAHLELLDDTGQLVLYSHPQKVIQALCAFRDAQE